MIYDYIVFMKQPVDCSSLPDAPTAGWLSSFVSDFQHRFINLLSFQFSVFPSRLALALLNRNLVLNCAAEEKKYTFD